MRTIVYQSYRTRDVPAWITTCLGTVRAWSDACGFDYRFYDDAFFDHAPEWFRAKAQHAVCPVTDLARLVVARDLLAQGYDRTIWVDADMLVFAPEQLVPDPAQEFMFCHEQWVWADAAGVLQVAHRVNNSITVFGKHSVHLDFFIDACLRIGRQNAQVGKLDVGTRFLSGLRAILPYPLLENVGMLSPAMMQEIALGLPRPPHLQKYTQSLLAPLACANLCGSLQGRQMQGVQADEGLYETVVQALLRTRGEVVNTLLQNRPATA